MLKGVNLLPRGKQIAAPKTDPSATFLARQISEPGTEVQQNDIRKVIRERL